MKKQIIITIILLVATAYVTVVYFKNLNPPGTRTSQVIQSIPDDASLIFEFNNDKGFYDIFNNNKLLAAVIGKQKIGQLDTLRQQLINNPLLAEYFDGQNIFISVHPSKTNNIDLLLSLSPSKGFTTTAVDQLARQPNSGLLITPLHLNGKQGYNIYINVLKKRFYVINTGENVFAGSFSKELIDESSLYKNKKDKQSFVLLSEQQSTNSLANLYVNYAGLNLLFDQLFKNKNSDIFKSFRLLPAQAALSLNYRSDALMFNGSTTIQQNEAPSYLTIFAGQKPVTNHLKDIFPSTTAYSTSFAVSDPLKFGTAIAEWHVKAGLKNEKALLFDKIKAETGSSIKTEFNNLLANEFAIVTTRFFEKFAIVSVKDGSKLKLLITAISTMTDEHSGQLNYNKLPFFLLGDSFSVFRKPYFIIIDNYLIMANSPVELKSYYDSYINRKFLSKNDQYNQFDELLAGQSNVSFFINFKNSMPIFERDLYPGIYDELKTNEPGWKNFYSASIQLSAADKNFYTNFCTKLNTDTVQNKAK
ncbi:hypothetical protein [Mucilaginibacter sp.]|uniref:hypothetical protein n=1 Tax=Mucilaginibacter sp. TaxID=1882438 RepID=UPI003D0F80D4